MGEIDPDDPFASLAGLAGVELENAKIGLIELLAEKGDQGTLIRLLDYLRTNEPDVICVQGAISCIPKLYAGDTDFPRAVEWMKTLGDTPVSMRFLSIAASTLGSFSPNDDAFFDLLGSGGKSEAWRDAVSASYSLAKTDRDPVTALDLYFESAPNVDLGVMETIIGRLRGEEQAKELLDSIREWPASDYKTRAEGAAFEAWANRSPFTAADAAKELSPASLESVMGVWATTDLKGAQDWLHAQPSGEARDHAILGLLSELKAVDPAGAASLAQSLENEEMRRVQTQSMLGHWRDSDPDAARKWALGNGCESQ